MPTVFIEAAKYALGLIVGAMALIIFSWIDAPNEEDIQIMMDKRIDQVEKIIEDHSITMDQVRDVMDKDSPWAKEKVLIVSRIDANTRENAALSVRIDNTLSKIDSMQVKLDGEIRTMHNSLYRIMAKLDLLEETKKKEEQGLP